MSNRGTIIAINLGNFGSTGNIMRGISERARKEGYKVYQAFPNDSNNSPVTDSDIIICSDRLRKLFYKLSYYTGLNGCFSFFPTLRLLRKITNIKPDIIHLHNLHNSYINIPLLFKYVKIKKIKIVWTLHDCWAFTGKCAYFTVSKCEKWKSECNHCKHLADYPPAKVDRTRFLFNKKKKWFSGIDNAIIVTPSKWLKDLVNESFLKNYNSMIINNGIDIDIFQHRASDFKTKYGLSNKYMVLGVAFDWGYRKGLDIFIKLAESLDKDKYRIVLVGVTPIIKKALPKNILSIERTKNQSELAMIYSAADVFVNPTREDNYPTVNLESIACGTPVITFDTGGSAEILSEKTGLVIDGHNFEELLESIVYSCECSIFDSKDFKEARLQFSKEKYFHEYVNLYGKLNKDI